MRIFKKKSVDQEHVMLTPQTGEEMVTFKDLGMHCVGCQANVKTALEEVSGAKRISVDLKYQSATVVFDPVKTTVDVLRSAVSEAGYNPKSESLVQR